jgi:carnitine O-acetyltransferase
MKYSQENREKANFDDIYTSPTPHAYINTMAEHGYEIGERARPYCIAAVELLLEKNRDSRPIHMLDIGCSYGMGSAFVKYGCSFDEMVGFFSTRAPEDPEEACDVTRDWLEVTPEPFDICTVGLDSSRPAIRFAKKAGMLDYGIVRDFENSMDRLTVEETSWLRRCDLLMCTGAIGYITDRTLTQVLENFGKDGLNEYGPIAVLTCLRMFDTTPIANAFERSGLKLKKVPGIMLPQRNFTNQNEQREILKILHEKGVDTSEWEDRGKLFAELFIASKSEYLQELYEKIKSTDSTCRDNESDNITYINR